MLPVLKCDTHMLQWVDRKGASIGMCATRQNGRCQSGIALKTSISCWGTMTLVYTEPSPGAAPPFAKT